jgi:hypothetical protein
MTVNKRSDLSAEKRVNRVLAGTASQNSTGRMDSFFAPVTVNGCTPLRVLTARDLASGRQKAIAPCDCGVRSVCSLAFYSWAGEASKPPEKKALKSN